VVFLQCGGHIILNIGNTGVPVDAKQFHLLATDAALFINLRYGQLSPSPGGFVESSEFTGVAIHGSYLDLRTRRHTAEEE
jgi:hypothetical protein